MRKNSALVKPDGLFRQNIVLMSGLVTAPIIVAATSAENSIILILSFFMITYTGILLCRFIPRKLVYSIRIVLYAVTAGLLYIPTILLLQKMFPTMSSDVVLYIELLAVNSLLLAKSETRFFLMPYGEMALDALMYVIGYAIAAAAVGVTREILAFGTIFGFRLFDPIVPSARSPFFGFILVGIFAAVCRAITGRRSAERRARAAKAARAVRIYNLDDDD